MLSTHASERHHARRRQTDLLAEVARIERRHASTSAAVREPRVGAAYHSALLMALACSSAATTSRGCW